MDVSISRKDRELIIFQQCPGRSIVINIEEEVSKIIGLRPLDGGSGQRQTQFDGR